VSGNTRLSHYCVSSSYGLRVDWLSKCQQEIARLRDDSKHNKYHVTMTSLSDVTESLDYVVNIDASPFTRALNTGNVTAYHVRHFLAVVVVGLLCLCLFVCLLSLLYYCKTVTVVAVKFSEYMGNGSRIICQVAEPCPGLLCIAPLLLLLLLIL